LVHESPDRKGWKLGSVSNQLIKSDFQWSSVSCVSWLVSVRGSKDAVSLGQNILVVTILFIKHVSANQNAQIRSHDPSEDEVSAKLYFHW
jgi:hypothetical protein